MSKTANATPMTSPSKLQTVGRKGNTTRNNRVSGSHFRPELPSDDDDEPARATEGDAGRRCVGFDICSDDEEAREKTRTVL